MSPGPPRLPLLLTIPLTLDIDSVPGCQPPIFVRHALNALWVELRVDVLVVAVSIVVGYFQPIACEVQTLSVYKWPIPFMRRPETDHRVFPRNFARRVP